MSDSINNRIVDALAFTTYPVYINTFTSTERAYFVYLQNVTPELFANNDAQYGVNEISLHFYCPVTQNTVTLRKQIKRALQSAGFTYPVEVDASDEHLQHIVFEFEVEEWLDGE